MSKKLNCKDGKLELIESIQSLLFWWKCEKCREQVEVICSEVHRLLRAELGSPVSESRVTQDLGLYSSETSFSVCHNLFIHLLEFLSQCAFQRTSL